MTARRNLLIVLVAATVSIALLAPFALEVIASLLTEPSTRDCMNEHPLVDE